MFIDEFEILFRFERHKFSVELYVWLIIIIIESRTKCT